jgi:hypothetical protein
MIAKKIIATILLIFFVHQLQAQSADAVVQHHISFIGGERAWKKIHTLKMTGEYDYGGMKFPFTSYQQAPDRYKFMVTLNGKYYAQGFDGKGGWKIDMFKNETTPTLLTGNAALQMANEADVELESPFLRYQKKGHQVFLEGRDTVEGKLCYKIKLLKKNGDTEWYSIDTSSYEIRKKTSVSKNIEMEGAILNTFYHDYRNVSGVKIPFMTQSETNGQKILVVTIANVEANISIDEKEFKP